MTPRAAPRAASHELCRAASPAARNRAPRRHRRPHCRAPCAAPRAAAAADRPALQGGRVAVGGAGAREAEVVAADHDQRVDEDGLAPGPRPTCCLPTTPAQHRSHCHSNAMRHGRTTTCTSADACAGTQRHRCPKRAGGDAHRHRCVHGAGWSVGKCCKPVRHVYRRAPLQRQCEPCPLPRGLNSADLGPNLWMVFGGAHSRPVGLTWSAPRLNRHRPHTPRPIGRMPAGRRDGRVVGRTCLDPAMRKRLNGNAPLQQPCEPCPLPRGPHLADSGPNWSMSSQVRPIPGQVCPTLVAFGPKLAEIGPSCSKLV